MKKCPKALKARVVKYTQDIHDDCIVEVFDIDPRDENIIKSATFMIRSLHFQLDPTAAYSDFGSYEEIVEKKEKVELLYQQKIKTLPTKHLNEILKAHDLEGGLRRAPKTIETITNELARRALLNDSSESDLILPDGDVDGIKTKSRKRRSKATRKRRKTSTSR